jgi:hypothetical protein
MSEQGRPDQPAPRLAVVVRDHGEAHAVAFAGEVLELICDRAHPPGRPLALTIALPDAALALNGKTIGSKRRPDGAFDVRLRMSSVRREQRSALERALGARTPVS